MKNLDSLKKRLTLLLSVIFIWLLLITWWSFFAWKYIKTSNFEINSFKKDISIIESQKWKIANVIKNNKIQKWRSQEIPRLWKIDYVYFSPKWEVINYKISRDINHEEVEKLLGSTNMTIKQGENSLYIYSKIYFKDWSFLFVFNKKTYPLSDLILDLFWFLIFILLFSWIVYVLWRYYINKLFVPIDRSVSDMKNFIQNASHELRTPISIIDSNLQLLDENKKYDAELIKETRTEIRDAWILISWLLDIANISEYSKKETIDFSQLFYMVYNKFDSDFKKKWIELNFENKGLIILANKNYVELLLRNIITNALKYTKEWRCFTVSYAKNELEFSNEIIKDLKVDWNKVFDRFYKWEINQNSEKSYWIGLSLVKRVCEVHWWEVYANSNEKVFRIKIVF